MTWPRRALGVGAAAALWMTITPLLPAAEAATLCRADQTAGSWTCADGWSGGGGENPRATTNYAVYTPAGEQCDGKVKYHMRWFTPSGGRIIVNDEGDNLELFACIGPPPPTVQGWLESLAPGFEIGHSPKVRGLVNLENWVWHDGDTELGPASFSFRDPTGIPTTTELRAEIEEYEWDFGDGPDSVFITDHPGSGDDIDPSQIVAKGGSQAAAYIWTKSGHYTMTATARWKGEFRQSDGMSTSGWREIPEHVEITETWGPVEVIEVRSELRHRPNG